MRGLAACWGGEGRVRLEEVSFRRPDGEQGLLGITLNPVTRNKAAERGVLMMAADVTDHKRLETELHQAQKLESIGQLAAGIAHEINTPIQYVGDNTRFLQNSFVDLLAAVDKYGDSLSSMGHDGVWTEQASRIESEIKDLDLDFLREEIPPAIEQSLEGIERVAEIVRAMKDFSHPGTDEKTPIDLNKAIGTTMTVCRNKWKYVADVATEFDPDLPPVTCLPGEVNQVFLNLITNAADAIGEALGDASNKKGEIAISTRRDADWIEVRVRDTGAGIPREVRSRIFDPFFTTKEVGKGTGQGLAISHHAIVGKHGGELTFETQVGKGTTFIVRLPVGPATARSEKERVDVK